MGCIGRRRKRTVYATSPRHSAGTTKLCAWRSSPPGAWLGLYGGLVDGFRSAGIVEVKVGGHRGWLTPPSHSIEHFGAAFFRSSMPVAVTFVFFTSTRSSILQSLRWTSPASLTCVLIKPTQRNFVQSLKWASPTSLTCVEFRASSHRS